MRRDVLRAVCKLDRGRVLNTSFTGGSRLQVTVGTPCPYSPEELQAHWNPGFAGLAPGGARLPRWRRGSLCAGPPDTLLQARAPRTRSASPSFLRGAPAHGATPVRTRPERRRYQIKCTTESSRTLLSRDCLAHRPT